MLCTEDCSDIALSHPLRRVLTAHVGQDGATRADTFAGRGKRGFDHADHIRGIRIARNVIDPHGPDEPRAAFTAGSVGVASDHWGGHLFPSSMCRSVIHDQNTRMT